MTQEKKCGGGGKSGGISSGGCFAINPNCKITFKADDCEHCKPEAGEKCDHDWRSDKTAEGYINCQKCGKMTELKQESPAPEWVKGFEEVVVKHLKGNGFKTRELLADLVLFIRTTVEEAEKRGHTKGWKAAMQVSRDNEKEAYRNGIREVFMRIRAIEGQWKSDSKITL